MRSAVVFVVAALLIASAGAQSPPVTATSPPPPSCAVGSGFWGVNCTLCNCNNGAACDDGLAGKGCICKPVHASGAHCQNCWFNYDPTTNCKTEINPCEHCPDSDYNNCTDLTSTLCPKYASCHYAGKTGTYKCKCGGGYYATPENGECVDVNECEVGVRGGKFNACPSYSTCKNYHGTYSCTCIPPRIPIVNSKGIPRYCVLPKN
eukprot:TRINITY_DN973_c0_g2_i1.p1 TRINITY_DN973_c0_g2~~TRINITY_DN973_c0_g2_i1.p1  ORF type:complete len:206 (-),score=19.57 TRINITY_DN973_c0_g2_i1:613-1230(-)